MASTNKTQNYELSQFIGTDKPAWLTDYNGDMYKIDYELDRIDHSAQQAVNVANQAATAVAGKQDALTFDDVPTYGSNNPVKSGGIYTAIANVNVQTDAVPTEGSTKAVQSGGVYDALATKQDALTFDDVPTSGSNNPVKSGGVYSALAGAKGWNTLVIFPMVGNNAGALMASSYASEILELPVAIQKNKAYEFEIYSSGIYPADATKTENYPAISVRLGDSAMTSATVRAFSINVTQVGSESATTFPRFRKTQGFTSNVGTAMQTNGCEVTGNATVNKSNLETVTASHYFFDDADGDTVKTHIQFKSNNVFNIYVHGAIFRYREL